MEQFLRSIAGLKGGRLLFLCHDQADSDALGAAFALSQWLGGVVGVPREPAIHTRRLVEVTGMNLVKSPDPADFDMTVVVDAANKTQLHPSEPTRFYLIDHHPDNRLLPLAEAALHDDVSSTCQLVFRLLKAARAPLTREAALALAAGILTDTIHFHKGDAESFRAFGELLEQGNIRYDDVKRLYLDDQRRDREVILRAALGSRWVKLGDYNILLADIHANIPTFVARALLDLGADMSVVSYEGDEGMEVRMYIREEMASACSLDAADLLRSVPGVDSGQVWGYRLFAAFRRRDPMVSVLDHIIATLKSRLCARSS
ncbi:MAG: DHH family phosphoesterase [Alicyclobacillaceae bacterium]|nr:DHH family phosphoesterase [Alicyclobacillaceae bacterium]